MRGVHQRNLEEIKNSECGGASTSNDSSATSLATRNVYADTFRKIICSLYGVFGMTACYVSSACNRTPHCADWGNNGLVCFGMCNAIAIYDPKTHIGRVVDTLLNSDKIVTVHWIKPENSAPEWELLSGCADGTVSIWSRAYRVGEFRCTTCLTVGEREFEVFADSLQLCDDTSGSSDFPELLMCAGANNELTLWLRKKDESIETVQTVHFGNKLPTCCRLTRLPSTKRPLLAVALENASVLLYVADSASKLNFVKVQNLHGHEDWIRCMDFCQDMDDSFLLATGSQDNMIRLWRVSEATATSLANELVQKREIFTVDDKEYNVTLESILYGHESWIYGVHWQSVKPNDGKRNDRPPIKLLSASFDKSMIIWKQHEPAGIWVEDMRVGEVGGNSLGFYGCKFSPDGQHIIGHDYQGSFHIWKYSCDIEKWVPRSAPSGHSSEVVDLCWEPKGRFLITASRDKTTRIHAPWKNGNEELWHEIARPQVHGYEMTCLVMMTPYMYASGAEEKVVRVFEATSAFRDHLKLLTDVKDFQFIAARGATVPSLGLTNKATFDEEDKDKNVENSVTNSTEYETLTEEELAQNTLWPELQKLYGHGYEIFAMATRYDGRLLATACKSTNMEHSAIILWDTTTWSKTQQLVYHQLTVTQMEFSPNGMYLLCVSRDRKWSLFTMNQDESYALLDVSAKSVNPHSRIIWCCAWTSDSRYFATGSRDGKIGIWSVRPEKGKTNVVREIVINMQNQPVTALCFVPNCIIKGSYIFAIGYDVGHIQIVKLNINAETVKWIELIRYDTFKAHHLTVKRLMFQPRNVLHSTDILRLASCGSDNTVKIWGINLLSLINV